MLCSNCWIMEYIKYEIKIPGKISEIIGNIQNYSKNADAQKKEKFQIENIIPFSKGLEREIKWKQKLVELRE